MSTSTPLMIDLPGSVERATLCPVVSNIKVTVDGHGASSVCLLRSYILGTPHHVFAEYRDSYGYDGRWLFTGRTIRLLNPRAQ